MMDDDRTLDELAAEPLDDVDAATLDQLRAAVRRGRPGARRTWSSGSSFSLALDEMFDEVARMTRVPLDAMAVRGEQTAGTRTETLTFSADRLTAMVTVSRVGAGRLRLDGWLAPPEHVPGAAADPGRRADREVLRRRAGPVQLRPPRRRASAS